MLPTSSILKTSKDTSNNVETNGCVPFATSNIANQPSSKIYHSRSRHNSVRNQSPVCTSTPARNRSKSSSITDSNTIRLIDFEDLTASSETLPTTHSNYSETDYMTSSRRRSLSNHFDDQPSTSKNSLIITNSLLRSETNHIQNPSGGIPTTSSNCLVFTNSRLQSEMNTKQALSSITFDDEWV